MRARRRLPMTLAGACMCCHYGKSHRSGQGSRIRTCRGVASEALQLKPMPEDCRVQIADRWFCTLHSAFCDLSIPLAGFLAAVLFKLLE